MPRLWDPAASALHSFEMTRPVNAANLLTLLRLVLVPSSSWPFWKAAIPWRWRCLPAQRSPTCWMAPWPPLSPRHAGGRLARPGCGQVPVERSLSGPGRAGMMPWWLVGIVFGRDFYILPGLQV